MKKITLLIILLTFYSGLGQTCVFSENFDRADNTLIGNGWTEVVGNSSIISNELVIETNGVQARDFIYQDVSSLYSTQLSSLSKIITWSFNMQQDRPDPSGFDTTNYGVAFVLGATNPDFTIGDGYAVVIGESGSTDNVRLVRYSGGIDLNSNLVDIIRSSTDFGVEHLSIKVTYNPSNNTWELFLRNDGLSFANPATLSMTDSVSTAIDATFTNSNLDFIGLLWNHNTAGANPTATFDNIFIGSITTWTSSSWDNGAPDISTNAVIDESYNTASNGSFSSCSLTVTAGNNLTVDNGYFVEVENNVTVDGQLYINPQGNFVQNNDNGTFTDNSTNGVVLSKDKTSQQWYSYTYWSSPIVDETIENALGITPIDRRFRYEAANFVDVLAEIGNTNTFTSGPDDFDDDGNDWQPATGTMIPGVGYAATSGEFGPAFPRTEKFEFYGEFNNGEILVPLINNSGGAYNDWNFIGNPYPGAISADTFFTVNAGLVDVIYLWDQGTPPSSTSSGNQVSNFSSDDYAMINGIGTVSGSRGDTGLPPNRYIPSGQGFFVEALNAGNVTFNNSMRSITADNSQFFKVSNTKKKSSSINNSLWINLSSDNGVFNQVMIGYVSGATNDNDGPFYDTPKITSTGAASILYTTIEGSNKKFTIQGKSINSINEDEVISLGFDTSIDVATLYTLSIAQLQGNFLNNNPIYLKDNLLNKTHDLTICDYTFTSEVGEFNERFEIGFTNKALSTEDQLLDTKSLKIIQLDNDYVQFSTSDNLSIKSVHIFDLLGRQLYNLKGNSNSETYELSNLNKTVYIAKVELSNGAIITKKNIKN
tara:strand:- start:38151 stop:40613 length:2463 start_codon:yes stop_codon:yes gene_type:complete